MPLKAKKLWRRATTAVRLRNLAVASFKSCPHGVDSGTFFAPAIPDEVRCAVPFLYGLDRDPALRACLGRVVKMLQEGRWMTTEEFSTFQTELGYGGEDFGIVFTGLYTIVRTAVRNRTTLRVVEQTLRDINVPEDHVADIVQAVRASRFELEVAAVEHRVRFPRVLKFRWRVDVTISTAALNRVLKPSILAQLSLSDGRIKTFEMSVEQFHAMRFAVARVLRDMLDLERHPIMKLAFDADKKEFDDRK